MSAPKSSLQRLDDTQVAGNSSKPSQPQAPISPSRMFREPKIMFDILKSTYSEFAKDNAQRMSAALAYYTIFSIAPLLVIAIAIAALVFGREAAQGALMGQVQGFVGQDSAKAIQTMIQSAQRPAQGTIATILGLICIAPL